MGALGAETALPRYSLQDCLASKERETGMWETENLRLRRDDVEASIPASVQENTFLDDR